MPVTELHRGRLRGTWMVAQTRCSKKKDRGGGAPKVEDSGFSAGCATAWLRDPGQVTSPPRASVSLSVNGYIAGPPSARAEGNIKRQSMQLTIRHVTAPYVSVTGPLTLGVSPSHLLLPQTRECLFLEWDNSLKSEKTVQAFLAWEANKSLECCPSSRS